ncbi:hypothetical protein NP493_1442g00000 [Ridgeia piscesae]|uniref:DED domain-containing protein n=1 Tax=Ridgeia piscesae TaxID=27915 RepID=A0AAD9K358_RIDPI|nr:hypothetical protein NP493_1442g00000 [Ridgeia piscesae]
MATTASKRNTSFKVSSYTRLLTHLSMELRRDDVNNIKFVCLLERGLSASRTDAVRSATDLLLELQKTGLISATNVGLPRGGSARHQATGPDHRRPQIQGRTQADGRLPCRHVDAGDVEEQQGRHRRGDDAERR